MAQALPVAQQRTSSVAPDRPIEREIAAVEPDQAGLAPALPGLIGDVRTASTTAGPAVLRSGGDHPDPLGGSPIPAPVLTALRRRSGGGRSLTPGVASELGNSLGPAAAAARIHTDGEADKLARSVQSVAFTYGSDVYFTSGSYAPDTERGQHLLAHELSHVAQGASAGGGAVIGRADDRAERDADRSAAAVVGALRRQATLRPEPPTLSETRPPATLSRFAVGLPMIRRVYTEEERPGILALPQVGTAERVTELEAYDWSAAHTRRLARGEPPPTYEQMNAIMAEFTFAQLVDLSPVCTTHAQLVRLAATAWSAAQLVQLAQLDPAPTEDQMLAVPEFFTPAQFRALWAPCENSVANVATLAGAGWTAAAISRLVADAENLPTWAQLEMIVTRLTAAQQTALVGAVEPDWANLARLAHAAGPVEQSPAITLRRALAACQTFIDEEIAALHDDLGLDVDRRRYAALLIGTDSIQGINFQAVTDYLQDARYFSICFDTARRLLNELGDVPGAESGGAPDATYALAQQQLRSAQLVQHITAASVAGAPVIFDIHVGGHGFTLTVIGDAVYQLEAFASQAGAPNEDPAVLANHQDLRMSLLTSIANNHTYTLAQITTALGQMTSDQLAQRQVGAGTMGWNAGPCGFTTGGAISDPMAIWWKSSSLLSNAAIVVRLAQRVQRQAAEIRAMFGVEARGAA